MWYCADKDARRVNERAGESADFRAGVFHPGRTGSEVCAEAREVRGRKDARYRRRDEDRGHAKSGGAGGARDCGTALTQPTPLPATLNVQTRTNPALATQPAQPPAAN